LVGRMGLEPTANGLKILWWN